MYISYFSWDIAITVRRCEHVKILLKCTVRWGSIWWKKFDDIFSRFYTVDVWLGVPEQIFHKLGVTVHQCLQGKAPQYLVNCCQPTSDVASRQRLRSSSRHHLVVLRHRRSTIGRRAFSVAGPMAWNALPDDLRDPSLSADNFRKTLKTHLFRNALRHLAH